MKKRVLFSICVGLLIVSLSGCGAKEETIQNNSSVSETQTKESEAEQTSESSEEATSDDYEKESLYWILQQDFSVPQKELSGTLYHESIVLPLDLTTLDGIAAPYICKDYNDKQPVDSISEILFSEERIIDPSSSKTIWTQDDGVNDV